MRSDGAVESGASRLLARVAVPVVLIALVAVELRAGTASLPRWLVGMSERLDAEPATALRVLVAVQGALALAAILIGRWARGISLVAVILLAFAAIAEVSALLGRGEEAWRFVPPAVVLAVSGLLLPSLLRRSAAATVPGGSTAWRLLALAGSATLAVAIAARVPVATPVAPATPKPPSEIVELRPEEWIGRPLSESGLPARIPQLTPATIEGRSVVVLHNPRCGLCHELFAEWFSTPQPFRVIALEIPPEPSALLLESEYPDEVACADCQRFTLPTGPMWLVQPPVVILVEDGTVRCVASAVDQVEACLAAWSTPRDSG